MSNRIAVFLKSQNPSQELPAHRTSSVVAALIVDARLALWTDRTHGAVHLRTPESWREVKARFRKTRDLVIQLINPPDTYYIPPFMTSYPPVPSGPNERKRQRELWERATSF